MEKKKKAPNRLQKMGLLRACVEVVEGWTMVAVSEIWLHIFLPLTILSAPAHKYS